jgi:hypothetical protein
MLYLHFSATLPYNSRIADKHHGKHLLLHGVHSHRTENGLQDRCLEDVSSSPCGRHTPREPHFPHSRPYLLSYKTPAAGIRMHETRTLRGFPSMRFLRSVSSRSSGLGNTVNKRASAVLSYPVSQARNCAQASWSSCLRDACFPCEAMARCATKMATHCVTPGRSLYLREVTTRHNTKSGPMQVRQATFPQKTNRHVPNP